MMDDKTWHNPSSGGVGSVNNLDELQLKFNQLGEGLGTAYERYALNRFLTRISRELDVGSVLEFPANGVMGVPGIKSMVLSAGGVSTTLANPSKKIMFDARRLWSALGLKAHFVVCDVYAAPFKEGSFDLCWNFCCFEHFSESKKVVSEMKHCSSKFLLIEVQNIFNAGFILHLLYHRIRGEPWDHGEMESMDWREVAKDYSSRKIRIIQVDGNDMPPWPDINMKVGDLFEGGESKTKGSDDFRPAVKTKDVGEILRLWEKPSEEKPNSPRMLFLKIWHDFVERTTPRKIRIFLCHHPYVIGLK